MSEEEHDRSRGAGAGGSTGVAVLSRSTSAKSHEVEDLDASAYMGEDVQSSDEEKATSGASAWIERGRLAKREYEEGRQRQGLRLRSAEPERRQQRPPWRAAGTEGYANGLRGIKRVLPRWQVEQTLEEEE